MASQAALDRTYMDCAFAMSKLSHAQRKKVGAVLVSGDRIVSDGVNGTPSGFDNVCEIEEIIPHKIVYSEQAQIYHCLNCKEQSGVLFASTLPSMWCERKLTTKPEVLHAESNAIAKIARSTDSSKDSTLYVTMSPCFDCAKLIIQAQIKRVVYAEEYRLTDGIDFLRKAKIQVDMLA